MIKSIILGLICFAAFLALHALVFRILRPKERFSTLLLIFLALIPAYILLYALTPAGYLILAPLGPMGAPVIPLETVYKITRVINFMSGLVLYLFLFLGYCQFYFIIDRSISVRVMIEIQGTSKRMMSFDEIERAYPYKEILSRRLDHMVEGGYIINKDGYYALTGKGRLETRLFQFLKGFLKLGKGG